MKEWTWYVYYPLRFFNVSEASTQVIWTTCLLNPHLVTTFEIRPDFCNLNSIHTHSGISRLDTLAQKFGMEFAPIEFNKTALNTEKPSATLDQ